MANLIIKPTSGGSLVLQDEGGDAALTVGTTGSTTLAGTANNLGTSTAGTLGSSVVFPAGHIVQTTTPVRGVTHTSVTSSMAATVVTGAITPKYDNSSILIYPQFVCEIAGESASDTAYGFKIIKTGTGVTTDVGSPIIGALTNNQGHSLFYRDSFQYNSLVDFYSPVFQDNDCETTNAVTYTVHAMSYGMNGSLKLGDNGWNNVQWSIFFQEIKR